MAQNLIQIQEQKQVQQLRLTQQQLAVIRMLEMPLAELEENVTAELDDNPALEKCDEDPDNADWQQEYGNDEDEDFDAKTEREEREEALDTALEGIGMDDEMPEIWQRNDRDNADYEEMVYGDTTSFYDKLKEQMAEVELTPVQQTVMEYLIGSLDDDGLLRKDLGSLCDELAIYNNVDVSEEEVADVLTVLQGFDPAGVGARSLKECLMLQIERKPDGKLKELMTKVVGNHYDEFTKKHWGSIAQELGLNDIQVKALQQEMKRLNPKPGSSLGETVGRSVNQITPDFIIDTDDEGNVSFTLNKGEIPDLRVSRSFADMAEEFSKNSAGMNRQAKEALLYAKEKVDKAKAYIDAVRQRRQTLYKTMKAIAEWQHDFLRDGDESELKPMILKDIAQKTGLDISTISRVSNMKYAQTRWGTYPLRFFFTDSYTTSDGEDVSTRKIKMALKEIVDGEDKKKPLSDDAIADMLASKGMAIARRTVAKYREQMGLPVARLRKE